MTTFTEIKQTIMSLSDAEFAELRRWMRDQDWKRWEQEFDDGVRAGNLDAMAADAVEAKANGTLMDL